MAFEFDFGGSDDIPVDSFDNGATDVTCSLIDPMKEISPDELVINVVAERLEIPKLESSNEKPSDNIILYRRNLKDVEIQIRLSAEDGKINEQISSAISANSDLIPTKYEGGLKTWECSLDLVSFLDFFKPKYTEFLRNGKVLEMGCGSGLPGIYCRHEFNVARVDFQDFNRDVLLMLTLVNLSLNQKIKFLDSDDSVESLQNDFFEVDLRNVFTNQSESSAPKSKTFAGDWRYLPEEIKDSYQSNSDDFLYDLILASETIYDPNSYKSHSDIFMELLHEDGHALVACKTMYFGCGGDTLSFKSFIENQEKLISGVSYRFQVSTVWESPSGLNRQILQVRKVRS